MLDAHTLDALTNARTLDVDPTSTQKNGDPQGVKRRKRFGACLAHSTAI